jgi:general secretion pathway protein D
MIQAFVLLAALAAPVLQDPATKPAGTPAGRGGGEAAARPGQAPATQNPAPPAGARGTPAPGGGQSGGSVPIVADDGDFWVVAFDEAEGCDLESLTKICQQTTGINFTYDTATQTRLAQAKVKIFGQKRFPKTEFYSFYQIIMFINGFVCTKIGPDGLSVVVIQEISAQSQPGKPNSLKGESIYVLPDELDNYQGQVATQIITVLHLPHTDVRSLGNSLRILSPDTASGGVIPVGTTNSVILQGFASNVCSLARILRLVDAESANDAAIAPVFEVLPLEFAAAQDISDTLGQLLEAKQRQTERSRTQPGGAATTAAVGGGGGETKILVDARTNSLLIMALPEDLQQIKELVARLDVDVVEPERTYHVYALENVKAKELAEVLEDFLQDASRVTQGGTAGRAQPGGNAAIAQGGTSRDTQTVVVPDEATNSLLIAASKTRYQEMLALIEKLDERQDQVLIETALVELSGSDFRDLGIELGGADLPGSSGLGAFGVSAFGLSTLEDTDGDGAPDIRRPVQNNGVTAGILDGDNFGLPVLLQAIKRVGNTNILNVPSVLVNNNGTAKVVSKDEQPTTTITATGGTGGQTQENFNEYQAAGITMQISPSISAAGYLRLDLFLEVSTFGARDPADGRSIPPPRLTRTIETSVNVPNGDTMVIGGIITELKCRTRRSALFQRLRSFLQERRAAHPVVERFLQGRSDFLHGQHPGEIAADDDELAVTRAVTQRSEFHFSFQLST